MRLVLKSALTCFFLLSYQASAQELDKNKSYFLSAIGFWNVENLYDTINDPWKNDEEFTPGGANAWNGQRYHAKIEHLAEAISKMAIDVTPDGLALLGLCEVENKNVVQDLVNSPALKNRQYKVVHLEGPDARGIDPAFVYNPAYFKVTRSQAYRVKLTVDSMHKTRNILVVNGLFLGEPVTVLVNHWPSRRSGEVISRQNRQDAATMVRHIADSLMAKHPKNKMIIMGDLNDDPVDESVKKTIGTYGTISMPEEGKFFNPMEQLYKDGIGTLAYKDNWNLFDQVLLSKAWVPRVYDSWQYYTVRVFNKSFLKNASGRFKGYPFRTYSGSKYTGGYSDHFPVYIIIAKEKK
jgi:predicted extracellular nuclease